MYAAIQSTEGGTSAKLFVLDEQNANNAAENATGCQRKVSAERKQLQLMRATLTDCGTTRRAALYQ